MEGRAASTEAEAIMKMKSDYVGGVHQYIRNAFESCLPFYNLSFIQVDGDGNCFFRSVVKYFLPRIPKVWENLLSLKLRKKLNSGVSNHLKANGRESSYPYHGFVIPNINDSLTMATRGVWADHIQVQKLATHFDRPVWLLTFDDVGLRMLPDCTLRPGSDYIIYPLQKKAHESPLNTSQVSNSAEKLEKTTTQTENPIVLYFQPTPGHYQLVVKPSLYYNQLHVGTTDTKNDPINGEMNDRDLLATEIGRLSSIKNTSASDLLKISPLRLCSVYFLIEKEAQRIISETTTMINEESNKVTDEESWMTRSSLLVDDIDKLMNQVSLFWSFLKSISRYRYLDLVAHMNQERKIQHRNQPETTYVGEFFLIEHLLRSLMDDEGLVFFNDMSASTTVVPLGDGLIFFDKNNNPNTENKTRGYEKPLGIDTGSDFPISTGDGPLSQLCDNINLTSQKLHKFRQEKENQKPLCGDNNDMVFLHQQLIQQYKQQQYERQQQQQYYGQLTRLTDQLQSFFTGKI